jgi:ATP synthase protein I
MKPADEEMQSEVKKDVQRLKRAARESKTLLAQTVYLGTLGIMLVLPMVLGAYLGSWLDERLEGYSFSWTISCIVIGVFVGGFNVYRMIRENM